MVTPMFPSVSGFKSSLESELCTFSFCEITNFGTLTGFHYTNIYTSQNTIQVLKSRVLFIKKNTDLSFGMRAIN